MNENENQDMIMLDFDELIQFIHEKTGYQKEMIENVFDFAQPVVDGFDNVHLILRFPCIF